MKRFAVLMIAALFTSAPASAADKQTPLPAMENGQLSARYSVHWGLLRLADLDLHWTLQETTYAVTMNARTRGLIRAIFKAESALESAGTRSAKGLKSARFSTQSQFNSKAFARDMAFAADDAATITRTVKPDDFDLVRAVVPDALRYGPDPLTSFLSTLLVDGNVNSARSYDGVQVLENTLDCTEELDDLKKTKRSMFHGPAQMCILTGDVIAGDVIEEDGGEEDMDGRDFTTELWFARTADHVMRIPVRVKAQSERGTLKLYLREIGPSLSP